MTTPAEASSKTYRKATDMVAERLGIEAVHTQFPSDDFERMVSFINTQPQTNIVEIVKIARSYFRLGVRKGLREAVRRMATGQFKVGRKWITLTEDVDFTARVTMPDGKQARITISFGAKAVGLGD